MLSFARRPLAKLAGIALVIAVILLNREFFKPEKMGPLTDKEKFSGAAYELQQTAGIYDYLPAEAKTAPKEPRKTVADVVSGSGVVSDGAIGTNWAKFRVVVDPPSSRPGGTTEGRSSGGDGATVRVNIFQFPDWRVFVNGQRVETFVGDDEWGRMHINVPPGEHQVFARLYNTPARTAGNTISLVSWALLLTAPVWRRR